MDLDIKTFGANLKLIRKQLGYTQESFAEAVQLSHSYIIKLENGLDTPGIDAAIKISNLLKVPLEFLLKDEGYRHFKTYANQFMIQEMERMDKAKFDLMSDALFSLYRLWNLDGASEDKAKSEGQ